MHADVVARCVQFGAQKTDIPIESKVNGCSFILTTETFFERQSVVQGMQEMTILAID